ncbi:putative potassium transport system protein [Flavobacterium cauense R2A-7]|uniref:KUP system potassium uptake protein n=1 Tax=Flavobacterium cauense R2A-7 TaxID=1341154 RepID=V6RY19_9FLAO|nr:KUP/HAK/KT family potassium transporter [Flavobacterium cauense]ESU18922.1 putative potassium transport system protein [Flavobacterium cauense R2A-7]KGO82441.1 potassium transporter Kup [Flavobacterium cauense R2A-7]TWI15418.1 KUP system potassium uptake protein [Flavobacterium cauense R2A-7]
MSTQNVNKVTAASLLVALGIIYGDIGTSPLYVMKSIIGDRPISELLVYGGISCVFWTLTFQTTFKYIFLTLSADNNGEGGVFSLYALVKRFGKGKLVIPTILGATTLLADGIITPPISVASAVEGLDVIIPGIPTIPIVIGILSALFFFQRFGTQKVGSLFGPAMVVWFSMLFVLGASQIVHHPEIFKALNPVYAYRLLVEYPHGFWLLGAVFLCTTGAEALYSDLGHCGRKNIRITWSFVKVSLLVNYLGQAAWLMSQGNPSLGSRNPFFAIMPEWFLIFGIIIATVAAIIASQALISGSYTLINEAISLNFWPRVALKNPTELKGQIYIPSINTILWIGCIMMILYFKNSAHMEAAYGFSITIAMLMTTFLLAYYLIFIKKVKIGWVAVILFIFSTIEVSFFVANVVKIKERWMFLFFELFIFMVMYVWYYARKLNNNYLKFVNLAEQAPLLNELSEDDNIPKYSTHLIYLSKADRTYEIEKKIIKSVFAKKPKRADVYWFLHINRTNEPYTLNYEVVEILDDKVIKLILNVGFRIQPRVELYFKKIVQELVERKELNLHIRPDGSTKYNSSPDFKFVIIEKFLSVENEFSIKHDWLLKSYFILKRLSISDEKAFGLDKSDVAIENVPMVYHPVSNVVLERKSS